jgi:hypothetical protein
VPKHCAWCKGAIDEDKRADSVFCGQHCRQASWRFAVRRAGAPATGRPLRFAYADPPYPGRARYYPERREVDEAELVRRLRRDYPDGWALSTSADALLSVWPLCPEARLCVWVRAPRVVRSCRAAGAFEALLVAGGRPRLVPVAEDLRDALVVHGGEPPALVYAGRHRAFPGAIVGMKPPAFCEWMFRLLGALPGDTLDDLYPGSGAVTEAWRRYACPDAPAMKAVAGSC